VRGGKAGINHEGVGRGGGHTSQCREFGKHHKYQPEKNQEGRAIRL
jgi:hypothetical protein